jgi:DNA repair exonuclease SbcCD ATPase subunit
MFQYIFFIFHLITGIGPKKPLQIGAPSATGHNACPICGIQLSPEELESHFSTELARLAKANMYNERQEIRRTLSMELHAVQSSMQSRTSRWEVRSEITMFKTIFVLNQIL